MKEKKLWAKTDLSIGAIKKNLSDRFKETRILSRHIDADLIISKVTGLPRETILAFPEKKITKKQRKLIYALAEKRVKHYPIAYITGYKDFYGLRFEVNENVLIPRPETEHMIDVFLKYSHDLENVLDLCCGTGCIGITVKHKAPHIKITLSDISQEALEISQKNAKNNYILNKIKFIRSNLLENIDEKFDAILCNPPYISTEEYKALSIDVHYEPKTALLAGENGLDFYEKIANTAKNNLNPGGYIFFEIGEKQMKSIVELYTLNNYIIHEQVKDYSGKDRILVFSIR